MPTETKAYSAGAERAALELVRGAYRNGKRPILGNADEIEARGVAEIISRETHDQEMLEALIGLLEAATARVAPGLPDMDAAVSKAIALIAKVERQQ